MENKPTYDELAAHVARLREALIEVSGINFAEPTKRLEDRQSWNRAKKAFESTPAQSLNNIKAQVEEETIERCGSTADNTMTWTGYAKDYGEAVRHTARKYKEQSNEDYSIRP